MGLEKKYMQILLSRLAYYSPPFVTTSQNLVMFYWKKKLGPKLTYSEPCNTSKMECFAKIANGFSH